MWIGSGYTGRGVGKGDKGEWIKGYKGRGSTGIRGGGAGIREGEWVKGYKGRGTSAPIIYVTGLRKNGIIAGLAKIDFFFQ